MIDPRRRGRPGEIGGELRGGSGRSEERESEQGGLEAIVVTASGCGTTIKDYGFMLRDDPLYASAFVV